MQIQLLQIGRKTLNIVFNQRCLDFIFKSFSLSLLCVVVSSLMQRCQA